MSAEEMSWGGRRGVAARPCRRREARGGRGSAAIAGEGARAIGRGAVPGRRGVPAPAGDVGGRAEGDEDGDGRDVDLSSEACGGCGDHGDRMGGGAHRCRGVQIAPRRGSWEGWGRGWALTVWPGGKQSTAGAKLGGLAGCAW